MTCYDLAISSWDATNISNGRCSPRNFLPNISKVIATATATGIITLFIKDYLQKEIHESSDLSLFTMRHSEETFAEIWNETEEDIWDEL